MTSQAPLRASWALMSRDPACWIAFGFGSGLAPRAPGTFGTLWGWITFVLLAPWLTDGAWAALILVGTLIGWWACTRAAQKMRVPDPGAVVWDEVLAFWLVLWLMGPSSGWAQLVAFALFRLFDAAKPGPVGWADRCFKAEKGSAIGWPQGFGILWDDFVAAGCTLGVLALWRAFA